MGEFDSIFADLDSSYTPGNSRQEEPESPFSSIFSDLDSSYSSIKAGEDYKAKGEAERGFFGDTVSHLARGGVGLLEATARGIETATGSETADKVGDYFRDLPRETAFLRPDESEVRGEEGVLKRGAMSAAESMPQSLSIIPAAMAGAAVGTAVAPGPGTIVGGIIGGASALGLTFGLGTYGKQKDAVNRELALTRPELTPEQRDDIAHDNALTHAQAEVGGEGVGDAAAWVIFKAVPGGSALYKGGKQILKELAAPGAMKTIGMGLLKDAPFEVGSEVGTSYFQNEADIEAGISKSTTADAMKEAIIPALFLTTGFGVTLGGMSAIERQRAYSQINSGTAEERQARVQLLAGNLAQATDKQVAKTWYDTAMGYVAAGDEIPLDVNVAELAARQPDGDAGQATQQAANHPATPDLTQDHTVSDVLATHRENLAANTVAGVLNQPESPNAVDIIPSVDNPYQRIDVPIEQQAPPAEIEQPNMEDVKRLGPHLREMLDLLVAKKEDNARRTPSFVMKATLKNWHKETGEDLKHVGSGPARETLEAIRTRQPLNETQAKVWSYLKSVAENKAMQAKQGATASGTGIPASTSINAPADRSAGELPADFGGGGETLTVPGSLTEEEIYSQKPKPLPKSKQGDLAAMSEYDARYKEWRARYKEAIQAGVQPPIQSKPPLTPSKLSEEIARLKAKKEEAIQPAADDERFTDMVTVLNNQTSAADLETSYQDMAGIFKTRPELAQYQERFAAARDAAVEKLKGVTSENSGPGKRTENVGDVRAVGAVGGDLQQEQGGTIATKAPEYSNGGEQVQADTISETTGNHEVINNTPDAVGSPREQAGPETPTVPAGVTHLSPTSDKIDDKPAVDEQKADPKESTPDYRKEATIIGTNTYGQDVHEDDNGRFTIDSNGYKNRPPRPVGPRGEKFESHSLSALYNSGRSEYLTKEEEAQIVKDEQPKPTTIKQPSNLKQEVDKAKEKKETPAPADDVTFVIKSLQTGKEEELTLKGKEQPDKFAGNKIFTSDAVAAARARLAAKRGTLSAGFDPELIQDMLVLGGAYFESGIRGFAEWSKTVLGDIGQEFKPFLRGTYENLRYYPGIETEGISTQEEVDAHLAGKTTDTTGNTDATLESLQAELAATDAEIEELYKLRECLKT